MKEVILIAFGAKVKGLRLSKKLSQEGLAQICDLDRTYISGVERGVRNVSLLNIQKLSIALEVEISELFQFGGENV
jgi:transcriptional regulator with XRE-family HTH domain